jgi:hypothetical protein
MPDPDTFDLDAAFHALEQDVAGVSSPLGASLAVGAARRRRGTTVAACVAGLALVVGSVALAAGTLHHQRVAPATVPTAPAVLDGPHLSAATHGWTGEWTANTPFARNQLEKTLPFGCMPGIPGPGTDASTSLSSSDGEVAVASMKHVGANVQRVRYAWEMVRRQVRHCAGATRVATVSSSAGPGVVFRVARTSRWSYPGYLWVVRTRDGIGALKVYNGVAPLPVANQLPVAQALQNALLDPDTFAPGGLPTGYGSMPVRLSSARAVARALTGWTSSGDLGAGSTPGAGAPPCSSSTHWDWAGDSSLGMSLQYGHATQEFLTFHSRAEATRSLGRLAAEVGDCGYRSRSVVAPHGTVLVLTSSAPGSQVLWMVSKRRGVTWLSMPDGEGAPPRAVDRRVGTLLAESIYPADTP